MADFISIFCFSWCWAVVRVEVWRIFNLQLFCANELYNEQFNLQCVKCTLLLKLMMPHVARTLDDFTVDSSLNGAWNMHLLNIQQMLRSLFDVVVKLHVNKGHNCSRRRCWRIFAEIRSENYDSSGIIGNSYSKAGFGFVKICLDCMWRNLPRFERLIFNVRYPPGCCHCSSATIIVNKSKCATFPPERAISYSARYFAYK